MSANILLLPELREMIKNHDDKEMQIFCSALHPASTADFLNGLEPHEIWRILQANPITLRAEIFSYFDSDLQVRIIEECPREEVAKLLEETPSDDRVDLLDDVKPEVVDELSSLLPTEAPDRTASSRPGTSRRPPASPVSSSPSWTAPPRAASPWPSPGSWACR